MKYCKVRDVKSPERGTERSAGIDFFVPRDFPGHHMLAPGQDVVVHSGVYVKVPEGHALIMMDKSGVATKKHLQVGACVIDEDFQGEVLIHVTNVGTEVPHIKPDDKLAQGLLIPINYSNPESVKNLEELYGGIVTERGAGALGSTDKILE